MKTAVHLVALAFAVSAGLAHAADAEKKPSPAQQAQQEKMKACNKDAADKKLEGDARKSFMKDCLSKKPAEAGDKAAPAAKAAPNAECEAKATEKKLHGAAKGSFMKKCEAEANKDKTAQKEEKKDKKDTKEKK